MANRRAINLRWYRFETQEDRIVGLSGETESRGRYLIRLADLDAAHAQWLIRKLADHIAKLIEAEREEHRHISRRIALAANVVRASLHNGEEVSRG